MNEKDFNPELAQCPERNARCTKLAAKAIVYFANGGEYKQLDPRYGGLAWNFVDTQHYDHIGAAVSNASGVNVERADTCRRPGSDETPTFGLKRSAHEDQGNYSVDLLN